MALSLVTMFLANLFSSEYTSDDQPDTKTFGNPNTLWQCPSDIAIHLDVGRRDTFALRDSICPP